MAEELNLRLVACLEAVLREGHFARAAERLSITPPALTQSIARLERQIGVRLIDRSRHPLRPTAAGERFLVGARAALEASHAAIAAAHGDPDARLTIGFIDGAPAAESRLMTAYQDRHPDYEVSYRQLAWSEQISALASGEVDAVFARPPHLGPGVEALRVQTVSYEDRMVALSARDPLAQREELHLSDIADREAITASGADPAWTAWWIVDPRPDGRRARRGPGVQTIEEALAHVRGTSRVLITAASVAERTPQGGDVVFRRLVDVELCGVDLCTRRADHREQIIALTALAVPPICARPPRERRLASWGESR